MLMRDFPKKERPVNRVCESGAQSVSNAELLASVLQTPTALDHANELLMEFDGLSGLEKADIATITRIQGLGRAQAARILAVLELGRRLAAAQQDDKYQIRAPQDVSKLLIPKMRNLQQEHFVVLYLDTRNRVVAEETLYKGTLNTSIVRVAEVFRGAIRRNCYGIIVAHNHPSGDPNPSPEDIALTRRLVDAGKMVEIDLLDHVVVGKNQFVSLRERGFGFEEL